MFKVKATVIGFMGNIDIYPCHMQHKIGDEVIFDGEKYHGRLCPDVWPMIAPKVAILHQAGPRYVEPSSYYPFWYCSASIADPAQKINDGLGFKPVLKTIVPPKYDMANLAPPNAFKWPPHTRRDVARDITVVCPDSRSSMVMKIEAFDLSDGGYDIPYFRRQMAILQKILSKDNSLKADKIFEEFTKKQVEEIYPPLSPIVIEVLAEELELMGYIKISNGKASVTEKGEKKLEVFKANLSTQELKSFNAH